MRLSSRGRNDSLKKLDPSVIERSYSRRGGGSCNTGLRGLMVAGDSKADARNKQNTIDQRYTARPFAVFKAIRRPCNFVKSRAFHRTLHREARTHTLRNQIISEFFTSAVTAITRPPPTGVLSEWVAWVGVDPPQGQRISARGWLGMKP